MCHVPEPGGAHHESGRQDGDVSAKLNAGGLGRSTGKTDDSLRG